MPRKKTRARILDLAAQGLNDQEIVEELGVRDTTVRAVLAARYNEAIVPAPEDILPAPSKPPEIEGGLAEVVAETRASHIMSARNMQLIVRRLEGHVMRIVEVHEPDQIDGHRLQSLMMSLGIGLSKQGDLLRALRDMEAEATDDLEAGWTVVVVEDGQDCTAR